MIEYRSKVFVGIVSIISFGLVAAGFGMLTKDPWGGFIVVLIHGGILVGLFKQRKWVIGVIRAWGILLFASMIILIPIIFIEMKGALGRVIGASAVLPVLVYAFYILFLTPKYIVVKKIVDDNELSKSNDANSGR